MAVSSTSKLIQKRVYDVLSHRYGTIIVLCGCILVIVSALQFGEVVVEWSTEKYAAVFNSFSDNVAGRSFRSRLCLPVPIDVVYTWVNGSDPKMLRQLHRLKTQMEVEINETKKEEKIQEEKCTFAHCVPGKLIVLEPAVPSQMSVEKLSIFYPSFKTATRMYSMKVDDVTNATVLEFDSGEEVEEALKEQVMFGGKNVTVKQGHYTSDWTLQNSVLLSDTIILSGFPHTVTQEQVMEKLPEKYSKAILKVDFHAEKGVAVLTVPEKTAFLALQEFSNLTIESKGLSMVAANLVWDIKDYSQVEDVASNRFEDNEELRYSLRSIEKFAPWVRNVYIVTNGQIPSWLNLDNPRLTLVTHEELFSNKSHLPSFSSPAIESHIHEIPGLSDKFLYLNDDVMFGREVWPDDFYSHAHGHKVYLTWPVPNCQDGCPQSWIRDGYCDKACNNSECEWDGGDCTGDGARQNYGWGFGGWQGGQEVSSYCNAGCSNSWIADRYCDSACNIHECGFDAGDCGTKTFDKLYELETTLNKTHYKIPRGEIAFYINATTLFGVNSTVTAGSCNTSFLFRTVAIAQKFKVITVVMTRGHNATTLFMELAAKRGNNTLQFNFTIEVDTREKLEDTNTFDDFVAKANQSADGKTNATGVNATQQETFVFADLPLEERVPRAVLNQDVDLPVQSPNMSEYELPEDIGKEYQDLVEQFKGGYLTEKGFQRRQALLWEKFITELKAQGKEPEKAKPKPVKEEEPVISDEVKEEKPVLGDEVKEEKPVLGDEVKEEKQVLGDEVKEEKPVLRDEVKEEKPVLGEKPVIGDEVKEEKPVFGDEVKEEKHVLGDEVREEKQVLGGKAKEEKQVLGDGVKEEKQVLGDEVKEEKQVLGDEVNNEKQVLGDEVREEKPVLDDEGRHEKPVPGDEVNNEKPVLGDEVNNEKPILGDEVNNEKQVLGDEVHNEKHILGDEVREEKQVLGDEVHNEKHVLGDEVREEKQVLGDEAKDEVKEEKQVLGDEVKEEKPVLGEEVKEEKHVLGDEVKEEKQVLGDDRDEKQVLRDEKEEKPVLGDEVKEEKPQGDEVRPKHVPMGDMVAALGVPDGGAGPQNLDNQRGANENQVEEFFQKKQQQVLQQHGPDGVERLDKDSNGVKQNLEDAENGHKSRKLQAIVLDNENDPGFLPWERKGVFTELQRKKEELMMQRSYETSRHSGRRLMDTFGDSLRHVNKLYNRAYGFGSRKVPAHMPHMIDRHIMQELHDKYPEEWAATSSHQIRSSTDMQFAFSYFYYLMSEPKNRTVGDIFDEMDVDHSGTFSDREIRTLATRLYDLPLDLQTLTGLEATFINCSQHLPKDGSMAAATTEKYYDSHMPQVTKALVVNCPPLVDLLNKKFPAKTKYKHEVTTDEQVAFKMIHTNVSGVVGQLDDIRKSPKKFICLNDNIDHGRDQAKTVKAILQDFYESLFPIPSSFELPQEYRNRFLHVDELYEWKKYRDWLRWWTQLALGLLIFFTLASFFSDKIEALQKKFFRRRAANNKESSERQSAEGASGSSPLVTV